MRITILLITLLTLFGCLNESSDSTSNKEEISDNETYNDSILTQIDSSKSMQINNSVLDTVATPVPWCEAQLYTKENHNHDYVDDENLNGINVKSENTLQYSFSNFYPSSCDMTYSFSNKDCRFYYRDFIDVEQICQPMALESNTPFDSIAVTSYALIRLFESAKEAREEIWEESNRRLLYSPEILIDKSYSSNFVEFTPEIGIDKSLVRKLKSLKRRVKGLDGTNYEISEWVVSLSSICFKFLFYQDGVIKEVNCEFQILHGGC